MWVRSATGRSNWPVFFYLAIWPVNTEIKSKLKNFAQLCWHCDGRIIAGSETDLYKTLEILTASGAKCNIELGNYQCAFWSIKSLNENVSSTKRNNVDEYEVSGAARESDAFNSSCLLKRVRNQEEFLRECRNFGSGVRLWYPAYPQNGLLFAMQFPFRRIKKNLQKFNLVLC